MNVSIWVILISLVIGIASNLLTPFIANFFGKIFISIKKRNERRRQSIENSVQYVLGNPQEEIILRIRYSFRSLAVLLVMLFSLYLMISNNLFYIFLGFIFFVVANFGEMKSNRQSKILVEVMKRKKKIHPEINVD